MPSIIPIADLTEITTPVDGCWIPIVDISEPLEINQTKKIKVSNVKSSTAVILAAAYPIGAIFLSAVSTNPATLLGFGTWTAFGTGRMPVGYDAGQTEFNAAEKTGGAKTHTLSASEMPVHTHTQNAHNHTQDAHNHTQDAHNHTQNAHNHTQDAHNHTQNAHAHAMNNQLWHISTGTAAWAFADSGAGVTADATATNQATTSTNQAATATNQAATSTNQAAIATNQAAIATNQNAGSGSAHENLPPYITVFMWRRTA